MTRDEAEVQDLYRELILDHSRNPRHFGKLDNATHTADGINPLCGDKLKIYVRVGTDGSIESTCFEGSGCAISVASASLMTGTVTGLKVDTADTCCDVITARLADGDNAEVSGIDFEKIRALDGVRKYPSRVKCATLAWHALHAALNNESAPASTE